MKERFSKQNSEGKETPTEDSKALIAARNLFERENPGGKNPDKKPFSLRRLLADFWRRLRSLKMLTFVIILLFGFAPGIVLRAGLLYAYENRAVEARFQDITGQAKLLGTQIASTNYTTHQTSELINTQLELMGTIYDGRIILLDQSFTIVADTYGMDEGKLLTTEDVIRAYQGETMQSYDKDYNYIEVTLPIVDAETSEVEGVMLISVSTDNIEQDLDYLKQRVLILQFILGVFIVVFGFVAASRMTRPLKRLTKSIQDVQVGYKKDFEEVTIYYETAMMSDACGDMLQRLQKQDEARSEFVSNVSHELKTPLTSMKVLADSLISQENVPIEFYKEFMTDIDAEIDRETKIINDLLSLVKMDRTAGNIKITQVNMNELLELIMKRLRPIARRQNVDLVLESFRPVVAEIDEVRMTLALSNLVENAIKYNHSEGWVHVSVNADHQNCFITVEDNGIGIPQEELDHIFDRFYRVDKSHSKEIGGTGLGLAIVKEAVTMHRGAIRVHSTEGEGTIFTVRIPLTYVQDQE